MISETEFWQQSLELYGDKVNQQALLKQQDSIRLNVNLALMCQCFDKSNITLTDHDIKKLHETIMRFSQAYTIPLRDIRKQVKQELSFEMPIDALREQLLKAELEFEKLEQKMLLTALPSSESIMDSAQSPKNYLRYVKHCQNLI